MIKRFVLIIMFFTGLYTYGQQSECRVLKAEISGTYNGDCKKGLANGKGIAQGKDYYEGEFTKGLPDGKGTYKWASGEYYEGQWKNGIREGSGKMVYSDSIVTGYWKGDKYVGVKQVAPYKVVYSMSVSRSTFVKSSGSMDGIKIKIMQAGSDNPNLEDFSLAYDSGTEYRNGIYYGLENVRFPLNVKIKYRTWNQLRTTQYNVIFEFVINEPGNWDVMVSN